MISAGAGACERSTSTTVPAVRSALNAGMTTLTSSSAPIADDAEAQGKESARNFAAQFGYWSGA